MVSIELQDTLDLNLYEILERWPHCSAMVKYRIVGHLEKLNKEASRKTSGLGWMTLPQDCSMDLGCMLHRTFKKKKKRKKRKRASMIRTSPKVPKTPRPRLGCVHSAAPNKAMLQLFQEGGRRI